jgi:hypothetical protein
VGLGACPHRQERSILRRGGTDVERRSRRIYARRRVMSRCSPPDSFDP